MPATHFICPDGERMPIKECLAGCRMVSRCMSLPTLRCAAYDRPLPDNPRVSASQAGTGIRLMYLRAKHGFAVNPMSRVYALFGTNTHLKLEEKTEGELLSEVYLENEWTSGTLDLYDGNTRTLVDFKTWGSFKCARALGLVESKIEDPSGEVYKRNGKGFKAGDPKMIKVWTPDPEAVQMWDTELQLNAYRIMLVDAGFRVDEMCVEAIVRDGNTHIAKARGLDRQLYHIPVREIDDNYVQEFFRHKTEGLRHALKTDEIPDFCTAEEHWDGRRCNGYCDVAEICNPEWLEKSEAA